VDGVLGGFHVADTREGIRAADKQLQITSPRRLEGDRHRVATDVRGRCQKRSKLPQAVDLGLGSRWAGECHLFPAGESS
jgi:hypothetical protein